MRACLMDGTADAAIVLLPEESGDGLRKLQHAGYPWRTAASLLAAA